MSLADGEFIAFLDHDDWFMPGKLERQVAAMIKARSVMSHTSYYAVFPERREEKTIVGSGKFTGAVFPRIMSNCMIATPTVMIHRSLMEEGFRFPENTHLGSDTLCWVEVARKHEILGIDEPLTTVEWSDQSAAVNLSKLIRGITALRNAYLADPIYRTQHAEIEALSGGIQRYKEYSRQAALNEQLVNEAFSNRLR